MALDADAFADLAVKYLQEELAGASPVVKNRIITESTAASGETRYDITDEKGPPEIDPSRTRPEMKAIGRALVVFLQQQAEIIGGKVT